MDTTNRNNKHVCYYITGHGLGHATRSLGVIAHLFSQGFCVHIVSSIAASKFADLIQVECPHARRNDAWVYHERLLDAGAVQTHALKVDPVATLVRYDQHIHAHHTALLDGEVAFLRGVSPVVVFVDASPLACEAAAVAGFRSLLLTNFTWDFCYRGMLSECVALRQIDDETAARYSTMIDRCSAAYVGASVYLQLPGSCPPPPAIAREKIVALPLGPARSPRTSPVHVRASLRVPAAANLLLMGFGGHSTDGWHLADSHLPAGWMCVVLGGCGNSSSAELPSARFVSVPFDSFVPDLIAAADVMLGKLGYGTMTECVMLGTPLVYVPRDSWPEEAPLESYITQQQAGVRMPQYAFVSGEWSAYLQQALALKQRMRPHSSANEHENGELLTRIMAHVHPTPLAQVKD